MRAETPLSAALKFWALRPRTWAAPGLLLAVACLVAAPIGPSRTFPLIAAAALFGGVFWLAVPRVLEVTDPARGLLLPGWFRVHRWVAALGGVAATLAAGSACVAVGHHPAPVAALLAVAAAAGTLLGLDARRVERKKNWLLPAVAVCFAAAGVLVAVLFAKGVDPQAWFNAHSGQVERASAAFFAGKHPLVAAGVAAAAVLLVVFFSPSLERRSRTLFRLRPAPFTPPLRVPEPPRPSPATPPLREQPPPLHRPAWTLRPAPRTAIGRLDLSLHNLDARDAVVVWLVAYPLCVLLMAWPRLLGGLEGGPTVAGAALAFVPLACLLSFRGTLRLARAAGEPRSLPRAVLLPRARASVPDARMRSLFLASLPAVASFVLFLSSMSLSGPGLMEGSALWPQRLVVAAFGTLGLLLWLTAFRHTEPFARRPAGKAWQVLLLAVFATLCLSTCVAEGADFSGGSETTPDDGTYLALGLVLTLSGCFAASITLRLSRRWDVATR